MVPMTIASLLAGAALASFLRIVPLALVGVAVFAIAFALTEFATAALAAAGLQVGYVLGLVLRALLIRVRQPRSPRRRQAAPGSGTEGMQRRTLTAPGE